MSISEDSSYGPSQTYTEEDMESVPSQYDNVRGDRYSEESSSWHASIHIDPAMKNKKQVKRVNPENGKVSRVEFFPTSTVPNAIIKSAISGTYQGSGSRFFRVGTSDEDLFFSVSMATGELGQEAPVLFYENPEQYERHFMTKLPKELKEDWLDKRDLALIRLKLQQQQQLKANSSGGIVVK
jgi:hypothetical protein